MKFPEVPLVFNAIMVLCDQCCMIKLKSIFGDYTITVELLFSSYHVGTVGKSV